MKEEMIRIREFGFSHIGDWTIFPWIATDDRGWEFTWVFFHTAHYWLTKTEYEEYMQDDDDDFGGHSVH